MSWNLLQPHPATPAPGFSLAVAIARLDARSLGLSWRLAGDLSRLNLPDRNPDPERRDELWRHTCFETFVRDSGEPHYRELNFSTSGDWAVYQFDAYRQGMASPAIITPPRIRVSLSPDALRLDVDLAPEVFGDLPAGPLRLALTAVVESGDGELYYWALNHPPGKPDFHHDDGFALTLWP